MLAGFEVGDWDLIGRLKSGLFTLVDGHFYYNNKVSKLRYDLLKDSKINKGLK